MCLFPGQRNLGFLHVLVGYTTHSHLLEIHVKQLQIFAFQVHCTTSMIGCSHTHTHARTHALTHTHSHTRAHTHTHTHTHRLYQKGGGAKIGVYWWLECFTTKKGISCKHSTQWSVQWGGWTSDSRTRDSKQTICIISQDQGGKAGTMT